MGLINKIFKSNDKGNRKGTEMFLRFTENLEVGDFLIFEDLMSSSNPDYSVRNPKIICKIENNKLFVDDPVGSLSTQDFNAGHLFKIPSDENLTLREDGTLGFLIQEDFLKNGHDGYAAWRYQNLVDSGYKTYFRVWASKAKCRPSKKI